MNLGLAAMCMGLMFIAGAIIGAVVHDIITDKERS